MHGEWEVVKESRHTSGAGHKQAGVGERGGDEGGWGAGGAGSLAVPPEAGREEDLQKVKETNIRALNPCPHRPH